jgi:hypothetical protein
MPQGGNFGGASIPDTIIGIDLLYVGRTTTYKDYTCTKIVATADTATFVYSSPTGVAVTFDLTNAGDSLDFMLDPKQMTAKGNGKAVALCYSCDCDQPMTGTTAYQDTGYGVSMTGGTSSATYKNPNTAFAATIIGGGGLNN